MIGMQEHYDLIAQFDKQFKGMRLDKEDKQLWAKGNVYQSGETNNAYRAFIQGYAFAKCLFQSQGGSL